MVRIAALFLVIATLQPRVNAQGLGSLLTGNKQAAPTASTAVEDALKRTTPRSSVYAFLRACHDGNYNIAAQYLDLRRLRPAERSIEGPELARQLSELLNQNAHFEVGRLSNDPQGNINDNLPPLTDTLATFELNQQTIPLLLDRVSLDNLNVWLVNSQSVERIPELTSLVTESPFEKKLPKSLVSIKLLATPLWIWIALILIALVLSAVSRFLTRIVIGLLGAAGRRLPNSFHLHRLEAFAEPVRLLLSLAVFRALMEVVTPSALLRDFLLKLLTLLFAFGVASFVMRIVDIIADTFINRLSSRERVLSSSLIPLTVRLVKIFIFCIGLLFVFSEWGYNTNTILAGVGVGGLAVALAAQKTIENLFGGLSILLDHPVLVGDTCSFGGQTGTVEDIGLRSTRVRTPNRTVVTIPNSVFSTMTLENFTKRDRLWFHPTLSLRRDTTTEQISQMMEAVTKVLQDHPQVSIGGYPLRFTTITNSSFDLEVFAYVESPDFDVYLRVQTELLLQIIEAANKLKVGLTVPFQENYNIAKDPG